jgi:5-methylcytosine-specific restriction endonuclease McrA
MSGEPSLCHQVSSVRVRGRGHASSGRASASEAESRRRDAAYRARVRERRLLERSECAYCGVDIPAHFKDHVVPKALGGSDDEANIVPCCKPCNASKSQRTPEGWLQAGLYGAGPVYRLSREERLKGARLGGFKRSR